MRDFARAIAVLLGLACVGQLLFALAMLVTANVVADAEKDMAAKKAEELGVAEFTDYESQAADVRRSGFVFLGLGVLTGGVGVGLWRAGRKPKTA